MISATLAVAATLMLNMASVLMTVSADDHRCKHTITEHQEVFYDVDIKPSHRVKRSAAVQPLRITLYFDSSVDKLPKEHAALIKTEVQKAVQFWQGTLKVRPTEAPIRLRRQCTTQSANYHNQRAYCQDKCASYTRCGEIVIPNDHLEACYYTIKYSDGTEHFEILNNAGPGVENTDFILYIASFQSDRCKLDRTVAYAAHCQQERVLDRPVAGYFSICPNSISDSWQERQQLLSTIKHEILHALGFTAGLYAFYRDADGNPLTERSNLSGRPTLFDGQRAMYMWSDRVVKNFTRTDWKIHTGVTNRVVMMMVTPKVVEEVRRHFGCPTLEGAELEDQGIDGTAITHWEKRVFENEAMTGTYTQNSVISRITLAMMEDTGWYKADFNKADNYEWGRGLGCDFVQNSCYHWISTRLARNESIYPFCRRVKRGELLTDCTPNRHAVALCNLVEYKSELAVQYQYFLQGQLETVNEGKEGHFGGSVVLADYCPYFQEFSWTHGEKILRGSSCLAPANSPTDPVNNFFGEYYGDDSRCFKHDGMWFLYKCGQASFPQHSGSSCYKVKCENDSGLSIVIGSAAYPCYHKGYVHRITFLPGSGYLHKGSIVCPACSEICPDFNVQCPSARVPEPSPVVDLPVPCLGTWTVPDINLLVSLLCMHFVIRCALDCCFTLGSEEYL